MESNRQKTVTTTQRTKLVPNKQTKQGEGSLAPKQLSLMDKPQTKNFTEQNEAEPQSKRRRTSVTEQGLPLTEQGEHLLTEQGEGKNQAEASNTSLKSNPLQDETMSEEEDAEATSNPPEFYDSEELDSEGEPIPFKPKNFPLNSSYEFQVGDNQILRKENVAIEIFGYPDISHEQSILTEIFQRMNIQFIEISKISSLKKNEKGITPTRHVLITCKNLLGRTWRFLRMGKITDFKTQITFYMKMINPNSVDMIRHVFTLRKEEEYNYEDIDLIELALTSAQVPRVAYIIQPRYRITDVKTAIPHCYIDIACINTDVRDFLMLSINRDKQTLGFSASLPFQRVAGANKSLHNEFAEAIQGIMFGFKPTTLITMEDIYVHMGGESRGLAHHPRLNHGGGIIIPFKEDSHLAAAMYTLQGKSVFLGQSGVVVYPRTGKKTSPDQCGICLKQDHSKAEDCPTVADLRDKGRIVDRMLCGNKGPDLWEQATAVQLRRSALASQGAGSTRLAAMWGSPPAVAAAAARPKSFATLLASAKVEHPPRFPDAVVIAKMMELRKKGEPELDLKRRAVRLLDRDARAAAGWKPQAAGSEPAAASPSARVYPVQVHESVKAIALTKAQKKQLKRKQKKGMSPQFLSRDMLKEIPPNINFNSAPRRLRGKRPP